MNNINDIIITGAREHNLKNINLVLPRNKMIVISGVSGSGKSSLAFDTVYAEGQRRYVESLSAYARQFLGQMEKPDVDYIDGLSPAISIEQKTTHRNPRSTVATVTEIYDYLRLLFARIGTPYCYNCGDKIESQTIDQIIELILSHKDGTKIMILAPIARDRKGEFQKLFEDAKKSGFVRVRVDGKIYDLEENITLEKNIKHTIEIVVDRIVLKENIKKRLADSVETALRLTDGLVGVDYDGETILYSEKFACLKCGISYPEIQPRIFSFNSPHGACKECHGLGEMMEFSIDKIIPNKELSINEGAILTHLPKYNFVFQQLISLSNHYNFSLDTKWKDLPEYIKNIIIYGSNEEIDFKYTPKERKGVWEYSKRFSGILNDLKRRYRESTSDGIKEWLETFMASQTCPVCNGKRLSPIPLSIKIENKNIYDITTLSVNEVISFFENLSLNETEKKIAYQILKELKNRLTFLKNVGLEYLTLDRKASTLSGGEAQRIRLATQIGSRLVGVLYILDEPTIGLHQRDNDRLLSTLFELRDIGNTLIVVEHDEQVIRSADYIVELGPGAGENGGYVIAKGSPEEIEKNPDSITGHFLSGKNKIDIPQKRRDGNGYYLRLYGAKLHNLKNINVEFPLGKMILITGVSGSGKSTLVNDVLFPILYNKLNRGALEEKGYDKIEGLEYLDKVINIDQSPIGRTPRSNPATYVGVFSYIRDLFASLEESKIRGYKSGRFSFNVKGGRCEHCHGDGEIKIEMHFLPDVYIKCDVCKGKRFNKETLEVKYKGYSIADVLDMTVDKACEVFEKHPAIFKKLTTLKDVGLGYIKLGQSSVTLSGGEAQRVKLALELSKKSTGKTLYILDEPTTGLHFADVKQLITVLNRLVDNGNTMIIIEHNLDVIKIADHIIDLGPEGGEKGGEIVAQGTPEEICKIEKSHMARYLKEILYKK
ncbi:MAG TPA: excinuclease ABC subunit UvrA [Spirochaetota bacterium]|nr:excinuclease ABC subunit UvrA [Spirochaetota bacterium]HOL56220.1 excinuclease ABC subunit UvrA [Spirochaetota bacterium]HPP03807.1 excinuclease ABC subunit UvrA [Spirochaetota bacterium]